MDVNDLFNSACLRKPTACMGRGDETVESEVMVFSEPIWGEIICARVIWAKIVFGAKKVDLKI